MTLCYVHEKLTVEITTISKGMLMKASHNYDKYSAYINRTIIIIIIKKMDIQIGV